MLKIFFAVIFMVNFLFSGQASAESYPDTPQWVKNLPAAKTAEQIFLVAGLGQTTAWISFHEKDALGNWRQIMTTPGYIGRNGLGKEREDDGKTPVGTFIIDRAFGIDSDPDCQMPYMQVDANYYWSNDFDYKYNQMLDLRENLDLNKEKSEHLIDYYPNYRYCLNISYNKECVAGKGSAIFIQCFGAAKTWTGGGISLPDDKMLIVMKTIRPGWGCVAVIDSLTNLGGKIQ